MKKRWNKEWNIEEDEEGEKVKRWRGEKDEKVKTWKGEQVNKVKRWKGEKVNRWKGEKVKGRKTFPCLPTSWRLCFLAAALHIGQVLLVGDAENMTAENIGSAVNDKKDVVGLGWLGNCL